MRKVLSSSSEVFHFWANARQSEGRAGSVFFEGPTLYSYGRHFAVAKHVAPGIVAFTLQRYSATTAKHIREARSAASHLRIVFCHDPVASIRENARAVERDILQALNDSEKPKIRQTTRDKFKGQALHFAERFNAYLHALPESERDNVTRFDTTGLEHIRVVLQENARKERERQEAAAILQNQEAAERLQAWKTDLTIRTDGFYRLPVALRLHAADDRPFRIQTSHGADIPVSFASRLWSAIEATRNSGADKTGLNIPCGVYVLNTIRADGSIVVGCHDIPYSELARMAVLLGFAEQVHA